jgi:hypothetical protein
MTRYPLSQRENECRGWSCRRSVFLAFAKFRISRPVRVRSAGLVGIELQNCKSKYRVVQELRNSYIRVWTYLSKS